MQVRNRAVILIGTDHIRVLIEAFTSIGHHAGDARSGLTVVNPVAAADHHLRDKLVGEADPRLKVMPVGHIVGALVWGYKNLAAHQRESNRRAADLVGVRDAATA